MVDQTISLHVLCANPPAAPKFVEGFAHGPAQGQFLYLTTRDSAELSCRIEDDPQ